MCPLVESSTVQAESRLTTVGPSGHCAVPCLDTSPSTPTNIDCPRQHNSSLLVLSSNYFLHLKKKIMKLSVEPPLYEINY